MTDSLTAKILSLHRTLDAGGLPHAFGGALALAFCTADPRGTHDIDVNIFCDPGDLAQVVKGLPREMKVTKAQRVLLQRDGQARLWWDDTPIDVFLSNHRFHRHVAANRRLVPFAGVELPVLACGDLAVFKVFFGRPKDSVDIATMAHAGALDLAELEVTVAMLLGSEERAGFLHRVREMTAELGGAR